MNWENCVVKINIKAKDIDFNHPLNVFSTSNSSGTGFFISKHLILTCFHVIKDAINIDILYKQTNNITGKIKYIFPNDDLAIISIKDTFDDINILDFKIISTRQIGDVYTIGFPLSSTNIKITKGIISGYQGSLIQTDATLNAGNSGGPLVIMDTTDNKFKIIGVNVSKLTGDAEKTGFVVPIYRFVILKEQMVNDNSVVIHKPLFNFDYQKIIQKELKENIFRDDSLIKYIKLQMGIRITLLSKTSYLNKNLKTNDVIISINSKPVDSNGNVKFDFYPEKISIDDLGLWFITDNIVRFKILSPDTQTIRTEQIQLKYVKTNLLEYYSLDNYPSYFVENNGLILSIISKQHMKALKELNLQMSQIIQIFSRHLYQQDLMTVYLADLDVSKINNAVKYPIGEIIIEINDKTFNNYNEFIHITKEPIKKIKTIQNDIYYV